MVFSDRNRAWAIARFVWPLYRQLGDAELARGEGFGAAGGAAQARAGSQDLVARRRGDADSTDVGCDVVGALERRAGLAALPRAAQRRAQVHEDARELERRWAVFEYGNRPAQRPGVEVRRRRAERRPDHHRLLLRTRSGLFDYTSAPEMAPFFDNEPTKVWTPQELLAISFARPPNFPPGTDYEYSNTNYIRSRNRGFGRFLPGYQNSRICRALMPSEDPSESSVAGFQS